ncbi:dihydrolipoyllysine-residue acetyltransferase [Dasania sp. GY-MA-18]|uniref:Acetyltransferase component of pyruvate dehydrogenase complex n=1 Tax=Dasania phycosphaerae TaxID=2950436 RepID=A0A9J6RQL7_9GAMM|nr:MULTISPECIES: dihydrolipoyllysine-residue acetyltransferase [Dasania]MCR8923907.1 dihydrolipoyllysine-residue acetyltransferase [Dasania sp. GY-MA-18]MCZ0866341.1 dihydrolipoyllysine-residue acetyltransferase [Dasania phycosphaerae]MCZ0870065.1 dihydrolipoyllysine-residue acetyltransferase [Dasania phycosphaerae]
MSIQTVKVPDIGGDEVEVIEICVAVGDQIAAEDSIVVLESDKASMEVPAPFAGTVKAINVAVGDNVSEGAALLEVEVAGEAAAEPEAAQPAPAAEPESESKLEPEPEPAAQAATAASAVEVINVPDFGGGEAEVIELCIKAGDEIAEGDSIIVLETDKASMEVPAPKAGKVVSVIIAEGAQVSEGAALIELAVAAASAPAAAAKPAEQAAPAAQPAQAAAPASSAPVANTATAVETIKLPDFGGGEAEVIEVCVAAGDEIAEGDSIIVLETDKASMEVPAPKAGKVVSITISVGSQASEGDAVLELEVQGAAAAPASAPAPAPAAVAATATPAPAAVEAAPQQRVSGRDFVGDAMYAGPAVRKIMREFGVDGLKIKGTGPKGRILKEDVQKFVKDALANKPAAVTGGSGIPPIPAVDFAQFGEVEIKPLSKIAKVTAANMQRSWLNVPHVTQFDDADISDLEDFRANLKAEAEKRGVKITPLPFLLKACANALRANPIFNSSLDATGENLVYKDYVHIGMAVDTPAGLMVPVIRDVDKKSIWDLAAETAELGAKAKDRKLKPADMQGGCFTISSLGNIGGTGFTPIVNAPEVAILGVSKLAVKPVWDGSEFVPRKMLPLALSYDHRVVNGADAGRFFTYLSSLLADIRRLAL